MPGLAGIIASTLFKLKEPTVKLMVDSMFHDQSYHRDMYVNEQLGLSIGWTCHRNSFSDCLPVLNEKKDLILLFAGEDYADKRIMDELRSKGHGCVKSDARYLIHLYEEQGEKFISELNGWFSGVLIDLRQKKIVLFNDRYAMHRVYYYEHKDAFYFASEAKALLRVLPELRKMNPAAVGEFLAYGCILEDKSLFEKVMLLPAGSVWTFDANGRCDKKSYFNFNEWENLARMDRSTFYKNFRDTFTKILPRYLGPKDKIGVSLTGGLDTRMIMASIRSKKDEIPCYTYGGMYRDCFDVKVARQVAKVCGQRHLVLPIGKEFLSDFTNQVERTLYITDGCADISASHEIYLSKMARDIAPIRITGNYGSEVLRSVNYIKAMTFSDGMLNPDYYKYTRDAVNRYPTIAGGSQLTYALSQLIPWHMYGRLAAAQSQLTVRTPYMDNDLIKLLYQAPIEIRNNKELSFQIIREGNPGLASIMTDRGNDIAKNSLLSKPVRLYREILFRAEYYYGDGMPHWLVTLDHAVKRLRLGRMFIGRHKIEHYSVWFRNELSHFLQDILLDARSLARPYVKKEMLKKIVNDHINGKGNYSYEINRLLTMEMIQRILID